MGEGYPHMGEWGVLGSVPAILKEAGRLLCKYIRLLHPFILAFLLPVALIELLQLIGLSWLLSREFGALVPDQQELYNHLHHDLHQPFVLNALGASSQVHYELPPTPPRIMRLLLVLYALSFIEWVLIGFALASISKTVQYIYSDGEEDPAIVKSIFDSLPEAYVRIFITSLWIFLVVLATTFVVSFPFYVLYATFRDKISPLLLESVRQDVVYVAMLILEFVFLLSQQVAVLEPENYGQAALKRGWKLVRANLLTALILFVIYRVIIFLLIELNRITMLFPATGELPHWTLYILAVLAALVYLAFAAYWSLVLPVLYFSSKLKCGAEEQVLPEENPYRPLAASTEN